MSTNPRRLARWAVPRAGCPRITGLMSLLCLLLLVLMPSAALAQGTITFTKLTPIPATADVGQTVTLTATVSTDAAGNTPITGSGTVLFCEGVDTAHLCTDFRYLGTAQVKNGLATLKLHPRPGSHEYHAVFLGTPNGTPPYKKSNSITAATVSVSHADVTVTITKETGTDPGTSKLTATVAGVGSTQGPAAGTVVTFNDLSASGAPIASQALGAPSAPAVSLSTPSISNNTSPLPYGQGLGDFNQDGFTDVAVGSNSARKQWVDIFFGSADGLIYQKTIEVTPSSPASNSTSDLSDVAVGDFNNDGAPDLVLAYQNSKAIRVLLNTVGTLGTFTVGAMQPVPDPATTSTIRRLAVGDLNGDGNLDIAAPNQNGHGVSILQGLGTGMFTVKTPVSDPAGKIPSHVAIGYLDTDDFLDMAFVSLSTLGSSIVAVKGTGDFGFTQFSGSPYDLADKTDTPTFVAIGRIMNTANADLLVTDIANGNVFLMQGQGPGTFQAPAAIAAAQTANATYLALADLNSDENVDLAIVSQAGTKSPLRVLTGNGAGGFTEIAGSPVSYHAMVRVAWADLNADGIPDVVALLQTDNRIELVHTSVLTTATAVKDNVSAWGSPPDHPVVAAFPGDALFGPGQSTNYVLLTPKKQATTISLDQPRAEVQDGETITLTARVTPPIAGGVATLSNDGDQVQFKNNGAVFATGQLSNGIATASVTLTAANSPYSLQAYYPGGTYFQAAGPAPTPPYTVTVLPPPVPSNVELTLTPGAGRLVTFEATVTENNPPTNTPVQNGTVLFCSALGPHCTGVHRIGEAQLDPNGKAKLEVTLNARGEDWFEAVFVGTEANPANTSKPKSASIALDPLPTTTTLTTTSTGNPYTFTATVNVAKGPAPDGEVEFYLDGVTKGRVPVGSGTETFTLSATSSDQGGNSAGASIGVGDFDQNGILDLAVANPVGNNVSIGEGSGTGTFTWTTPPLTPATPNGVVVADLNNDGKLDLAVAQNGAVAADQGVRLFKGQASLTFDQSLPRVDTGNKASSVAVGDLDGNGLLDIVAASQDAGNIAVMLNQGTWTFTGATPKIVPVGGAAGPVGVAVRKVDFDDIPDVIIASVNTTDKGVWVLKGKGDGSFGTPVKTTLRNAKAPKAMAVGDLDEDGFPDVVTANGDSSISILFGNGSTTFGEPVTAPITITSLSQASSVALADYNGDGWQDVAVTDAGATKVYVVPGTGTRAQPLDMGNIANATADKLQAAAAGDFDGDGIPDLAAAKTTANSLQIVRSSIAGTATATMPGINFVGSQIFKAEYIGTKSFGSSQDQTTKSGTAFTTTISFDPGSNVLIGSGTKVIITVSSPDPGAQTLHPSGSVHVEFNGVNYGDHPLHATTAGASATQPIPLDVNDMTFSGNTLTAHYPTDTIFATADNSIVYTFGGGARQGIGPQHRPEPAAPGATEQQPGVKGTKPAAGAQERQQPDAPRAKPPVRKSKGASLTTPEWRPW